MMARQKQVIHVIGGGLAGSEAAWQLAQAGVPVVLHEMRPERATAAHKTGQFAELVCSNSFRSDDATHNAVGLLHEEMRRLGSLVMRAADANQVPAGGALAVDRDGFAAAVTAALEAHPLDHLRTRRSRAAAGRLGQRHRRHRPPHLARRSPPASAQAHRRGALAFFDAIAPIVHRESIDLDQAWFQSRYDKAGPGGSGADYINCPLTREQYDAFVDALIAGDKTVVPRLGSRHALFRRLPADRGDGRARARNPAARADEAVRPDQSARARAQSPMRWCNCARTTSSARCSTWSASRPS